MKKMPSVLVVDDDAGHRLMLETLLAKWGFRAQGAANGVEAVNAVRQNPFDAVLMDVRMPDMDGVAALKAIKSHNPAVPVVLMTAYSTVENAVEALKSGAYDYLLKPLDFDALKNALRQAMEHAAPCSPPPGQKKETIAIVGDSPPLRRMLEMIRTVAPSEATVLVTGKSGTGKELVARAIHELSVRAAGPLVTVNCAALAKDLLESELFGHEKGAFTGAERRREGRFLQASGGTLFLDEIGELPLPAQAKLLRALQQKEIQRVGSDETLFTDVRIVAATNRNLQEEMRAGRFREDLYYRLNVVSITVPALCERREDIPLLAQHFLALYADRNRKDVRGFTPRVMDMLIRYGWPGNVRELENAVERAVVLLSGQYVSERELPPAIVEAYERGTPPGQADRGADEARTLEAVERDFIVRTVRECGDNKSEAAKRLGISRKTLHARLKNYSADTEKDE